MKLAGRTDMYEARQLTCMKLAGRRGKYQPTCWVHTNRMLLGYCISSYVIDIQQMCCNIQTGQHELQYCNLYYNVHITYILHTYIQQALYVQCNSAVLVT